MSAPATAESRLKFPTLFPHGLWMRLIARHGVSLRRLPNAVLLPLKWTLTWPFHLLDRALYSSSIQDVKVRDPVFVIGHFRSGTTYLQRLLSAVPPFATPSAFQVIFAESFLASEGWLKGPLQRISTAVGARNQIDGTPLNWDYPGEEDVALFLAPFEGSANWAMVFPRARSELLARHLPFDDVSAGWMWFVHKVQVRHPGARLVLKNPPSTCRIDALAAAFPGAKFVYLYRDPFALFASLQRFFQFVSNTGLHVLTESEIDAIIVDSVRSYHAAFVQSRARLDPSRLVLVRYEDLDDDPSGQLAALWERLDLGLPYPASAFDALIASAGKSGKRPILASDEVRRRVERELPEVVTFWEREGRESRYPAATREEA